MQPFGGLLTILPYSNVYAEVDIRFNMPYSNFCIRKLLKFLYALMCHYIDLCILYMSVRVTDEKPPDKSPPVKS